MRLLDLPWYKLPSRLRSMSIDDDVDDLDEQELDEQELDDEVAAAVTKLVNSYKMASEWRAARYNDELCLFEGLKLTGYAGGAYTDWAYDYRDVLGIIRAMCEHAVADVYAPLTPKPQFQTTGATWDLRRRAKRMDRICEARINSPAGSFPSVQEFMQDAGYDCAIHGIAPVHIEYDEATDNIEHTVHAWPNVFFDPREGRQPKNLFWREAVDAEYAHEKWGLDAEGIENGLMFNAVMWKDDLMERGERESLNAHAVDQYEAFHAIRLPISPKKPGRHVIVIGGVTVLDEEWKSPLFPFLFIVWEWCRKTMDAQGIAALGGKLACDASDLRIRLDARIRVGSKQRTFYVAESIQNVVQLEENDEQTNIAVEKGAQFPQTETLAAFSSQDVQYLEASKQDVWDKVGLSRISAAARREPGLSSGIAQITLNNTKQGRQLTKAQRYEGAFVSLGYLYYYALKRQASRGTAPRLTWAGRNVLRELDFADADLGDTLVRVTVNKASALPRDPVGRQQVLESAVQSGLFTSDQARRLLDWNDIEAELSIDTAEVEYLDMLIDRYLDATTGGENAWDQSQWDAPEGFITDKVGAIRRFTAAWYQAKIDQAMLPKDERKAAELPLKLLSQYIQGLAAKIPPPPAASPAPAAAPGAIPVPTAAQLAA